MKGIIPVIYCCSELNLYNVFCMKQHARKFSPNIHHIIKILAVLTLLQEKESVGNLLLHQFPQTKIFQRLVYIYIHTHM